MIILTRRLVLGLVVLFPPVLLVPNPSKRQEAALCSFNFDRVLEHK